MDHLSKTGRSRLMATVKRMHTAPELYVRQRLFAAGFRYRLHTKNLPGRPDIVLPRYKVAVFVHGCFWHGHTCSRGKRPISNTAFWNKKLDANRLRDKRDRASLKSLGWRTVVIWQCALARASERLVNRLKLERADAFRPERDPSP
jgi:DNA mismatch endonuclease (patch repair protein)